jgi:mRNA-degrading endonuclease toxin of MazEF toxin-antitoxin module
MDMSSGRRPSIILQNDGFAAASPLVLTIPLTTYAGVARYPGVVFVPADLLNGLTVDSYALVFQIRATDRNRFQTKLGDVSASILAQLFRALDLLSGHP